MKISCQSCQAKYTIADEKVLGKIVKIRCKKCGATIVINGNDPEATAVAHGGAGGGDYAQGGDEQWTVNVAEGDQRTMTVQEIAQEFKTGVVTDETFCWKDGMNDWLPLREIDTLYAACTDGGGGGAQDFAPVSMRHEPAPAPYVPPAPNTAPMMGGDVGSSALFGGGHENGNGASAPLFGSGSNPPAAATSAAARRTGGRRDHGTDLFGNVAAAGGEDDVMTSAANVPQPSGADAKLTGQRNENSVLFSLNALTTNAPSGGGGGGGGGGGVGLGATTAQGDGSGLIDIRALSATMASDNGPKSSKHVDDIMNLGGGGAFSAALNAPILAPPPADMSSVDYGGGGQQQSSNKTLYAIIGGCGLLAVSAIVVALIVMGKKPDDTVGTNPNGTVSMGTAPTNTAPTATETVAAAPTTTAAPTNTSGAKAITPGSTGGGAVAMGGGPKATGGHATTGGGAATAETPTPPPADNKPKDLLSEMNKATGNTAPKPTAEAPTSGSAPFDRGAAAASLGGINVASCKKGDGPTGGGHVKVTFAPSGTVSTVDVDAPPFSGTPVGGCVAGKYRSAHVPAFSGGPVTVGKSFSIN
ncbi:MAG: virulence associated protein [Myxococcaceae bacterium]|nr:virulence associated protein [Myxococcaceae bacterium]